MHPVDLNCLLVVDMQNDFVDPSGALYVNGADKAVDNLIALLDAYDTNARKIDFSHIILTQDSHIAGHVSMSSSWKQAPPVGTQITSTEIREGKYTHIFGEYCADMFADYLDDDRYSKGRPITIWPDHCVLGSWGWAFPDKLVAAIHNWIRRGFEQEDIRTMSVEMKGLSREFESYSLFTESNWRNGNHGNFVKNECPFIETRSASSLCNSTYDHVYICGVAGDYCVADTFEDLSKKTISMYNLDHKPSNAPENRFGILDDCIAFINDTEESRTVYENAIKLGFAEYIKTV